MPVATTPKTRITRMIPSSCPLISDILTSFLPVKSHDCHSCNGNNHLPLIDNKGLIIRENGIGDFLTDIRGRVIFANKIHVICFLDLYLKTIIDNTILRNKIRNVIRFSVQGRIYALNRNQVRAEKKAH